MGYIVDITIILEGLFWIKLAQPKHPQITGDDVEASFNLYKQSEQQIQVHREIRSFVDRMNFIDAMHPDESHLEVVRLIKAHRRDFINENNLKDTSTAHKVPAAGSSHTIGEVPAVEGDSKEDHHKAPRGKMPVSSDKNASMEFLSILRRRIPRRLQQNRRREEASLNVS